MQEPNRVAFRAWTTRKPFAELMWLSALRHAKARQRSIPRGAQAAVPVRSKVRNVTISFRDTRNVGSNLHPVFETPPKRQDLFWAPENRPALAGGPAFSHLFSMGRTTNTAVDSVFGL